MWKALISKDLLSTLDLYGEEAKVSKLVSSGTL